MTFIGELVALVKLGIDFIQMIRKLIVAEKRGEIHSAIIEMRTASTEVAKDEAIKKLAGLMSNLKH